MRALTIFGLCTKAGKTVAWALYLQTSKGDRALELAAWHYSFQEQEGIFLAQESHHFSGRTPPTEAYVFVPGFPA